MLACWFASEPRPLKLVFSFLHKHLFTSRIRNPERYWGGGINTKSLLAGGREVEGQTWRLEASASNNYSVCMLR